MPFSRGKQDFLLEAKKGKEQKKTKQENTNKRRRV